MAKKNDTQEKLINFAVQIVNFAAYFPKDDLGKHAAAQVLKFGTSPATNYSTITGKEEIDERIAKLESVLNELNQIKIWFEIVERSEILQLSIAQKISDECTDLCKLIKSRISSLKRKKANYQTTISGNGRDKIAEKKIEERNGELESAQV